MNHYKYSFIIMLLLIIGATLPKSHTHSDSHIDMIIQLLL